MNRLAKPGIQLVGHTGSIENQNNHPAGYFIHRSSLDSSMQDVMKTLVMFYGIPLANKLISFLKKLHMQSGRIGGATSKAAVTGVFSIGIFEFNHVNGRFNPQKYLNHFNFGKQWYDPKNILVSIS